MFKAVELGFVSAPLHKIHLKSDLFTGSIVVGVRPTLPVEGISMMLGNDVCGERVIANPIVSEIPSEFDDPLCDPLLNVPPEEIFPACAVVTRAMRKKIMQNDIAENSIKSQSDPYDLLDTFIANEDKCVVNGQSVDSFVGPVEENPCGPMVKALSSLKKDKKSENDHLSRSELIIEQKKDPEVIKLSKNAVSEAEIKNMFRLDSIIIMEC